MQVPESIEAEPAYWVPPPGTRLAASIAVRWAFPFIRSCLGASSVAPIELAIKPSGVVGWGDRLQARLAKTYADARNLPFWRLEDGFFRSVGLGKDRAPSVSLLVDDLGIHFSAQSPSRLERLLNSETGAESLDRAKSFREFIVRERLSKYNHLPDAPITLPRSTRRRILLVDQVRGDRSVGNEAEGATRFGTMWDTARAIGAQLIVRAHPDTTSGQRRGYLTDLQCGNHVTVVDGTVSPHALLDVVDEVWTVSSQFGLDALLRGIPVITFGLPAYAGWGLTSDRADDEVAQAAFRRRTQRLSIDQFVATALMRYPMYFDPVRQRRTSPEAAAQRLVAWRARALSLQGRYVCVGMSWRKRKVVRRFLAGPWAAVHFANRVSRSHRLKKADHVAVWGPSKPKDHCSGRPLLHIEDGFIRSAGLGSTFAKPASLCIDALAPWYDATTPSQLEHILNNVDFSRPLLNRAARLRQTIVRRQITKYNLPHDEHHDYRRLAGGRPIVVVAAQVPDDASLRYGLAIHQTNAGLLAAVRRMRPDAFLVYKDHPDLVHGRRRGRLPSCEATRHADLIVANVSVEDLLLAADEVHVATSQLGYEAVLRERTTYCHGMPFYAGWGLTEDLVSPLRPRRRLSLDALVAGTLILYPRYSSLVTNLPCEVEDVIDEICQLRAGRPVNVSLFTRDR